jgi:5-methylcytosine-specific restriction endonuclease McrA
MWRRSSDHPCSCCGEQKPRTREFYYANKRAADGLLSCCKQCHLARTAANEKRYPRDRRNEHRKYSQTNRAKINKRTSPSFKRWRNQNHSKRLAWEAAYRRTPTYRMANVVRKHNRRAQIGKHTVADFQALLIEQAFRCFYCGCDITNGATEDHFIPLSKGGSNDIGNIRGACWPCNNRKGSKPASYLMGGDNSV